MERQPQPPLLFHLRALAGPQPDEDSPDSELLRAFLANQNEVAFSTLMRRHGGMILSLCRRLSNNEQDAEDAFQATFLVLARKAYSLKNLDSLASWLYGVARRICGRARRGASRRRARESSATHQPVADPLTEMTVAEAQEIVDEELAGLPERFRAPLVLCCLEGLARDEAARQLGVPVSLVKSRLEQGREYLRRRLAARGLALPAGLLTVGLFGSTSCVAATLVASTGSAARLAAAGLPLTNVVSPSVVALVEKTMRSWFVYKLKVGLSAALLCLVLAGTAAGALLGLQPEQPRPAVQPAVRAAQPRLEKPIAQAPIQIKPEALAKWSRSEAIVVGRFTKVIPGPKGLSEPPVYSTRLEVMPAKVLRGGAKAGEAIQANHVVRQEDQPQFPQDKDMIIGLSKIQGVWKVMAYEVRNDKNLDEVKLASRIPIGWTAEKGKLVSPWASLGKAAWPASARGKGAFVCSKTGRPAFLAGAIELGIEVVEPKVKLKYGNPDGDGEFKLTVKNPTDKALTVPALLSDGKDILWNESLVILCQGKTYTVPGSKGVSGKPKAVVLKPGESVSTVVNALALKGPEWPRGGYRIEFTFALGEKSVTKSFYYLSKHHDPIRDKAQGGK